MTATHSALESFGESLRSDTTAMLRMAPRAAFALLTLLAMIWVGRLVGRLVVRLLHRGKLTGTHRNFFRQLTTWIFGLFGLALALNLLGLQGAATGLLAGGGITAVALGFAFRGIGENMLAGFFLAFSRPFDVGDLIQSGEFKGVVRGIELRSTHIRTGDGRDVYIPSAQIFNQAVVNFTRDGLRRLSYKIGIDYGDDSAHARKLLFDAVRRIAYVLDDPPPAVFCGELLPGYQEIEVAFWVDMFNPDVNMGDVRSNAVESGRRALQEAGFTLSSEVSTAVVLTPPPQPTGTGR